MPMAGFGGRWDLSYDGVHDPLQLTSIYFEHDGREAWICTADLCEFPNEPYKSEGVQYLTGLLGCPSSALFLNASHTHGGPQLNHFPDWSTSVQLYNYTPARQKTISAYVHELWKATGICCSEARRSAEPSLLSFAEGQTSFPMNRRRLLEGRIENAPNPEGTFDDRLRLMAIHSAKGELKALGLLLACHPTATSAQHRFTADYVAGWRAHMRTRLELGSRLFFMQTCCGDARPAHTKNGENWRPASLAEIDVMGRHLADETERAMAKGFDKMASPKIRHIRKTAYLPCEKLGDSPSDFEQLRREGNPAVSAWARSCLDRLKIEGAIPDQAPVDLTLIELGEDTRFLGGDCEFLHGIGKKIEKNLGVPRGVAFGYTNGTTCYVPDREENKRGGYEAESYLYEAWSGPFKPESEDVLLSAVRDLCKDIETIQ